MSFLKRALGGFWNDLAPKRKSFLVIFLLVAAGIALGLGGYVAKTRQGGPQPAQQQVQKKEIKIDEHQLEKSAYLEGQRKIDKYVKDFEEVKKRLELMEGEQSRASATPGAPALQARETLKTGPTKPQAQAAAGTPASVVKTVSAARPVVPPIPVPPPPSQAVSSPGAPGFSEQKGKIEDDTRETVGGIEIATNKNILESKDRDAEKKSKKNSVYLPPSFMAATMLSGLDAPTVEGGKSNPVPVLLRIKDLAFLPNKVRANLKGCFVISDGYGSLADERAHLRIKNLSCLSRKGTSVIDQELKGFVVDTDGKIGLRGEVISKMGSVIARSLLAGFFGGIGDAFKAQSQTVAVSPLGTTQSIDTGKTAQAGLGEGLSQASKELQKFYLDLARQTMPVVEVGAVRDVTLVVSEGTELNIKEINTGGKQR
ncbi:MAG: TraB/VirB10 family protein [Syntrophales bacterium]